MIILNATYTQGLKNVGTTIATLYTRQYMITLLLHYIDICLT